MLTSSSMKSALVGAAFAVLMSCGTASSSSVFSFFGFDLGADNQERTDTQQIIDLGGNVSDYFDRVRNSPGPMVIAGVCASACTMKLGSRNACVEPDATLLFHQASYNGYRSEIGTRMMFYAYPTEIRNWVLLTGALNSSSVTKLSGRQAIALGVRGC